MVMTERTQSMDWFGEPWPSAARRAPVCSDDGYRAAVPIGIPCDICKVPFVAASQGVLIPMTWEPNGWTAYHIDCFMGMIMGKRNK